MLKCKHITKCDIGCKFATRTGPKGSVIHFKADMPWALVYFLPKLGDDSTFIPVHDRD